MLECFGVKVILAENGEIAVNAVSEDKYDLVFMDCQMPVMDGYEATRRIRKNELILNQNNSEITRLPIIALTAHTMSGDVEKCLAAGMDDFLGKPFELQQLENMLKIWLDKQIPSDKGADIDMNAINRIRAIQKNPEDNMLKKVYEIYVSDSQTLINKLEQGISTKDNDIIKAAAHSLKSSSANLGAAALASLCQDIEKHSKESNSAIPTDLFTEVKNQYHLTRIALDQICLGENYGR